MVEPGGMPAKLPPERWRGAVTGQDGGMQRMPMPWQPEATLRQRAVPAVAAVIVVGAFIYALLPFTFAGRVECSAALGGSAPAPDTPAGVIVGNPDQACADTGGRRLVSAVVVGGAALVLGLAGAFLPSDPPSDEKSGDVLAREPADGEGEGDDGGGDR